MLFSVDVEADGPCPGAGDVGYSMASFGVVPVFDKVSIKHGYYSGPLAPICTSVDPGAIAVHKLDYSDRVDNGKNPKLVMEELDQFLKKFGNRHTFISDNNGFDWQFMNFYFHYFLGRNPFGFSSRRIGDIWAGFTLESPSSFKKLRKTKHSHNALDDAYGNAEAILEMVRMGALSLD